MIRCSFAMASKPMQLIRELSHMKNIPSINRKSNLAVKLASSAAVLISSLLLSAPMVVKPALASDMVARAPDAAPSDQGRVVRMNLNKTMIIHLPADAKDVLVGNVETVDAVVRNKNTLYIFSRHVGSTNVFVFDPNGDQVLNLDLEVTSDPSALQNLLRRTIPGTHITVDTIGANVVLAGIAMNPSEAKTAEDLAKEFIASDGKIVNTVKIAGEDQVMLQVKIVEIQRDVLKQWGINLKAVLDAGSFAFNLSNINPFNSTYISPNQGYGAAIASGGSSLSGVLRAMESDGMLHTLAEPNLTALSGQAASFKAGGEFPFQTCEVTPGTVTTAGTRRCEIKFKEYGVGLDFTPTVLSAGRINIKIHTSVSELNNQQGGTLDNVASVPSLNTRSAETVLEMPDGGSMMLAGLIRESTRQTINGTPGLKKLPILGALFRSRDFIQNQTELVVLVTPHIVRSVAQKQLESPDKNFNVATDRQSNLLGRLNKVYGKGTKTPTGSYSGNVGYIVE
jgi:pilus assembly protein CpaC